MITQNILIERITQIIRNMDGDEIAELCNREFGMNILYVEDYLWEDRNCGNLNQIQFTMSNMG